MPRYKLDPNSNQNELKWGLVKTESGYLNLKKCSINFHPAQPNSWKGNELYSFSNIQDKLFEGYIRIDVKHPTSQKNIPHYLHHTGIDEVVCNSISEMILLRIRE